MIYHNMTVYGIGNDAHHDRDEVSDLTGEFEHDN